MKNKYLASFVVLLTLFISACSDDPEPIEPTDPNFSATTIGDELVNHPQRAFGGQVPQWVMIMAGGGSYTELVEMYDGYVVFTENSRGEDLEALRFWVNQFDITGSVASQLSTFYSNQAAAYTDASEDDIRRSAESLTAVASEAEFNGLRKESEYWLQYLTPEGETYFDYYVIYVMEDDLWEDNLERIIEGLPEEEQLIVTPILDQVVDAGLLEGYNQ